MNKAIVFITLLIFITLLYGAGALKKQKANLNDQTAQWQDKNRQLQQEINYKESLVRKPPVPLSAAYNIVMNTIRWLEDYSACRMKVQLEAPGDIQDITRYYEGTPYQGIRGLKIQIIIDQLPLATDMATVLDDIHALETHSDFLAAQIIKENNDLMVKGEIYGL